MIQDSSKRRFDVADGEPSMKLVMASGLKVALDRSVERSGLRVRGGQLLGSRGSSSLLVVAENPDVMIFFLCSQIKKAKIVSRQFSFPLFPLLPHRRKNETQKLS